MADYTLFGNELCYFSLKLEAAMRFYGLDFEFLPKTSKLSSEIEMRAGTHQVPVLLTPEDWMIADTTPLLQLLDARIPQRVLFPPGPTGVVVHLLEEYFDEWIAPTTVHFHWLHKDNAPTTSMVTEAHNSATDLIRCRGTPANRVAGTDSPHQQRMAEEEYERLLDAMNRQFQRTPFLMGQRPTAVDCVVLGSIRDYTSMDLTPGRVLARYPRILQWADRGADSRQPHGNLPDFPLVSGFGQVVLEEMLGNYLPYALGNRDALRVGARTFQVRTYGDVTSYLCRPYVERSRQMIVSRVRSLRVSDQRQVAAWLVRFGLDALLPELYKTDSALQH